MSKIILTTLAALIVFSVQAQQIPLTEKAPYISVMTLFE
jgi:hypothetical protein